MVGAHVRSRAGEAIKQQNSVSLQDTDARNIDIYSNAGAWQCIQSMSEVLRQNTTKPNLGYEVDRAIELCAAGWVQKSLLKESAIKSALLFTAV
ncbi:hypothetical protein AK812_SmicGene12662 [Symbiodinium microadriaticum]|uniref:Uncharacterized protein n=1 Tax=Symbiodinium microadriaticum TaxID=2951 RepID=A0A1Q9EA41_SYMMI|nr:hypothetical protein AK812_SmicGene12662 [Symbiodinium microadriaticum]